MTFDLLHSSAPSCYSSFDPQQNCNIAHVQWCVGDLCEERGPHALRAERDHESLH